LLIDIEMKLFGFTKEERLCSKIKIDNLFSIGISLFSYPLRAVLTKSENPENEPSVQVLFVVPRKKFKRAVDRNLIRRRMREAYRLNKSGLIQACNDNNVKTSIAFLFVSSDIAPFDKIEKAIQTLLNSIIKIVTDDKSK
jgi:ribonuclease P protein component